MYLVTSADQPDLGQDDRLLHEALQAAGVPTRVVVWTDADVDWARASVCVIRSVWDYHLHPDRFRSWIAHVSAASALANPPELLTWNMHKRYLHRLAAHGVPTVATRWITPGGRVRLDDLLADAGRERALIKPAVSASAWKTAEARPGDPSGQRLVEEISEHTDVMVQPYLESVERDGEISLIAVDGTLTHAARRPSTLTGDIETTRRGVAHAISDDERRLATKVLSLLPVVPLYARIDLLRDDQGRLLLGELELIEPVLYLRHSPHATAHLVAALGRRTAAAAMPAARRAEPATLSSGGTP